ncbi:activator of osmoprotectant transporter [Rhodoferax ferrireducens T118]|uniref:Activator of osmoprotectant transporter n=1 Tax=Albidiferax ferrireducens (strain ATCC BAA-621 / DSM 15236 / T118) TaxID=338969 RepID=Q21RU1_ALBFT|nr:ProQ/FINO family protein [Rhodoferax ferrireducens]ABD71512.1 activator of osmoprotectant transporter [Rhodoferax ferrireducens T118]
MTRTTPEAPAQADTPTQPAEQASKPGRSQAVQPVLEKLFELYPHLFGAEFLPLKLGIFQELLALHPEQFQRDSLKLALGLHTRSTRYLQSVAAGKPRHDLQGAAVEAVAPEHVHFALLELFRRRQGRTQADLRPKLRAQLLAAFAASGLTRQEYQARVLTKDASANTLLEEAFAELDQKLAKQEALLRAFNSSGKTPAEFADMYGLDQRDVMLVLDQGRSQPVPAVKP